MKSTLFISFSLLATLLVGCGGGGSSSDESVLLEGVLIEDGGAADHRSISPNALAGKLNVRHSTGQTIEEVEICALGRCSITNDAGQWGFYISESETEQEVEFAVLGHGIDTAMITFLPWASSDLVLDLRHRSGGVVVAAEVVADGISYDAHGNKAHDSAHDSAHEHGGNEHGEHDHSEHDHGEHEHLDQ